MPQHDFTGLVLMQRRYRPLWVGPQARGKNSLVGYRCGVNLRNGSQTRSKIGHELVCGGRFHVVPSPIDLLGKTRLHQKPRYFAQFLCMDSSGNSCRNRRNDVLMALSQPALDQFDEAVVEAAYLMDMVSGYHRFHKALGQQRPHEIAHLFGTLQIIHRNNGRELVPIQQRLCCPCIVWKCDVGEVEGVAAHGLVTNNGCLIRR